ncbi:MAG: MBL fold metallo-hydrolase [Planctomycetota bacterium]|jgi:glyoxylase-like metal-dependent hydrolase (beta-lactamase superfamily II)
MATSYRIITIGTLSRNRCWNENAPKRASYSTTTLVRHQDITILIDPGLPPQLMAPMLDERAGITPEDIDVVFLTTFRPVHRRSLSLFHRADWLMHANEIEAVAQHLDQIRERNPEDVQDCEVRKLLEDENSILARIKPAQDKLTPAVHLYPTPGVTPGSAGLLLALPSRTVIIAGDAVVTQDYCLAGRIFEQIVDRKQAQESFADIVQIADDIIPGHDNVFSISGR